MNAAARHENGRWARPRAVLDVARGSVASLYYHRALALFSLVSAFAIWFVIQDVENPRVTRVYPESAQGSIEVRAINADRLIPTDDFTVTAVEVQGRQGEIDELSDQDFEATIDVKGIPANVPTEVPIRVTTGRDGLKILSVTPATVLVTLELVVEREFEVRLSTSGQLRSGFVIQDQKIEPLTVKVSGRAERLDNIATVDLEVNLGAVTEGETVVEGDLQARGVTGSEVAATISPARGKVTYDVRQLFAQRSLPVDAPLAGQVAPGYRVTNITVEPPSVFASGPADKMAGLAKLLTEPIQLGNATGEIRRIQDIQPIENISFERPRVSVRIEVAPIECAGVPGGVSCGPVVMQVGVVPVDQPTGLVIVSPVRLAVNVQLTGPLNTLNNIQPGQITARASLAGGLAGPGSFPVTVVIPPNLLSLGVRAEPVANMNITLGPGP